MDVAYHAERGGASHPGPEDARGVLRRHRRRPQGSRPPRRVLCASGCARRQAGLSLSRVPGVRPAGPSYRIPRSSNSRGEVQAVHLQAEGRPAALWAPHLPPLRRRVALCRTVQLRQVPHVPHRLRRQRAGHAGVGEGGAGTAPHRAKPRVRRDVRRPRILPSSRARGRAVAAAEAQRAGVSVWRACKERENSAKKHWKRVGCGAGSVSMLV
mmetsp:Transcript_11883/g.31219  ORF Transcript_11883/g.31219 Transcript_11883/m.31219 type:complete len:212 (-) Transcript_11883:95-730(-)